MCSPSLPCRLVTVYQSSSRRRPRWPCKSRPRPQRASRARLASWNARMVRPHVRGQRREHRRHHPFDALCAHDDGVKRLRSQSGDRGRPHARLEAAVDAWRVARSRDRRQCGLYRAIRDAAVAAGVSTLWLGYITQCDARNVTAWFWSPTLAHGTSQLEVRQRTVSENWRDLVAVLPFRKKSPKSRRRRRLDRRQNSSAPVRADFEPRRLEMRRRPRNYPTSRITTTTVTFPVKEWTICMVCR